MDNYSASNIVPRSVLKDANGNLLIDLETTDISLLKHAGWTKPEKFTVKADDGMTDLHGIMFKPFDFDSTRQYPIISYVYPGPQVESFGSSKEFTITGGYNTALAQLWDEEKAGEGIDKNSISSRREKYNAEVPEGVYMLTCAVDVQDARLELEVLGWGINEENWSICYKVLYGDPGTNQLWDELDDIIEAEYTHELGVKLKIAQTCIDSGGHHTEEVYQYCVKKKKQRKRRVFPVKGSSQRGQPIKIRASRNNDYKIPVWLLGVDTAKETIYSRLTVKKPGASYMHFPDFPM